MTRVNQNQPKPVQTRPSQSNQSSQKAGEKGAFSKRMDQQKAEKKDQQATAGKQSSAKAAGDQAATLMRQRGGFALSRGKGTVADLQAKLEQQSQAALGKQDATSLTDASAGKGMLDQVGEGKGLQDGLQSLEMQQGADALQVDGAGVGGGQGLAQLDGGNNIQAGGILEVKGTKLTTAQLDKIVDQARVGVNATGAPEFQFDLKGDVLGGLKMRISMEDGGVKATFIAENSDVRKLIDGNIDDLKKALAEKGINLKELEIRDPQEDQRQQKREQNQQDRQNAWDQA